MRSNISKNVITSALLSALLIGSVPAFAVQPKLKLSDITIPTASEENQLATKRATTRLTQSHYRKISLDDAFSEKIFDRYIKNIDFSHNTFLQSDVDELRQKYGAKLDDQLNQGDLSAAFDIYDVMMKRRYERYAYALSLLDKEPNLNGQDQIEIDREKAAFPKTEDEANQLWEERVKNDIINLKLKDKKWSEIKSKLTKRYNLAIRRLTQTKADDILQTYLNAFSREIDPHTTGEIEDIVGWRLEDIVEKIKGKKGTKVRLEIEPSKGGKSRIITLVRDKVRIEDQAAKLTMNKIDGKNIAVIKIPGFYIGLTSDVKKLLTNIENQKADALIVDLRENGGGALTEAVALSGLFITDGPVVQVRDAYQRIRVHEDDDSAQQYKGPLLVMINRYSASASEIFAAAMQDYNRGIIIGQNTFGKGTVQQSRSLNFTYDLDQTPLGLLQYTIQKFYRINGGSTQLKGVAADINFPEIIDAKEYGEDKEDNALPWDKIPSATYTEVGNARKDVDVLNKKHFERIAKDPEFIALNEDLKIRNARRDRKFLSLNYQTRKAENDKDDARRLKDINERFKREGKKALNDIDDLPKDYEAPDFFLKEAEKMAADFVMLNSTEQDVSKETQKPTETVEEKK